MLLFKTLLLFVHFYVIRLFLRGDVRAAFVLPQPQGAQLNHFSRREAPRKNIYRRKVYFLILVNSYRRTIEGFRSGLQADVKRRDKNSPRVA